MVDEGSRPLDGLRVLEFGHVAAGPFAAMVLADLGADVVKIEPPAGDHMRRWPPFAELSDGSEFSLNFASVNRGKRSICADLKDPAEADRVRSLAGAADVVVENYRPGVLERLGLGFERLAAAHPRGLVYCSVSGYGQHGPYRERGAFDVVVQAESGLMSVTGENGQPPVKCGVPVGDFVAGLYAAVSVLSALETRRREQRSVRVDCPMLSSLLAISALQTSQYWGTGEAPEALGSAHPRNAPYQAFQAQDRPFAMAAGTDELWRRVADVVGRTDLVDDPRFATQRDRATHQDALASELDTEFRRRPAEYWLDALGRRGVPSGPVNGYPEILRDPHVDALQLVRSMPLPDATTTPTIRFPAEMSGIDLMPRFGAPALGDGADDVIKEWLG